MSFDLVADIALDQAIVVNPLVVSPDMSVTDAIACMSAARAACSLEGELDTETNVSRANARATCLLVMQGSELVGILTDRDVVRLSAAGESLVDRPLAAVMTRSVITLRQSEFTDVFAALQLFQRHQIRHLPIVDDQGQVIGLLTHETLRQLLRPVDLLRLRLVSEVMASHVVHASPETSVLEIARLMTEHRVSSVVIVETSSVSTDSSDDPMRLIPVGMVTEGDIVQFQALNLNFQQIQARIVMSSPVFVVHPQDSLWAAQQWMQQKRLSRLVVAGDDSELLGIVTQSTLLQALNPIEIYKLVEALEQKNARLEAENAKLLQLRNAELEQQVQQKIAELQYQYEKTEQEVAERRQAETALRQSEATRQAIFQGIPDLLLRVNARGERLEVLNGGDVSVLHPPPGTQHPTLFDTLPEPVASQQLHYIHQALTTGRLQTYEQQLEINRQLHWEEVRIAPLMNDEVVIMVRDITARKQAELAFQSLVEGAAAIAGENFFVDLAQYIAEALDVRCVVMATQVEGERNALHSSVFWLDGQVQPNITYQLENAPCSLAVTLGEYICLSGVQQQFPGNQILQALEAKAYVGVALTNTQREIIGCLNIVDRKPLNRPELAISMLRVFAARVSAELERQAAMDALRQLNEALEVRIAQRTSELLNLTTLQQAILNSTDYSIISVDPQGILLTFNAAAERMLGYTAEEVVGKVTPVIFHDLGEMVQRVVPLSEELGRPLELGLEVFVAKAAQGISTEDEWTYIRKDGSRFPVLLSVTALRDGEGQITGYLGIAKDITQQKRAEEQLHRTLKELSDFKYALDEAAIVAITDAKGCITYTNDQFCRISKYSRQELIGKTHRIVNSGYHPKQFFTDMWRTISSGKTWRGEIRNRAKDGTYYWTDSTIIPFLNQQGQPVQYLAIRTDINDRKQAELELQELLASLQNAMEGMARIDQQGCYLLVNRAYAQACGYGLEEMVGLPWQTAIHPEDLPVMEVAHQTMLQKGKVEVEARGIRKDGSLFYQQLTMVTAVDQAGQLNGYYCFLKDISERKETEKTLERQLRAIEATVDGVAILQGNSYIYVNRSYLNLFGYTDSEELIGQPWDKVYSSKESQRIRREVFPVLGEQGYWQGEAKAIRKDGSTFAEELSLTLTANGELICVCRDITQQKQAEAKIRQANDQLLLANAELERATRIKADFLANMSHEIRTPMNAVIGMTHLVLKTELTLRQREYLKKIQSSSQHLLGIINDILDFSKIEAGKLSIESIDFELEEVLENVATLIGEKAVAKGLELIFDIDRNLPRNFVGDPLRLGQLLINYANNAVKFTETGEIAIIVRLKEYRGSDVVLYLAVRDTGIGITQEQMGSLFNSFQQADSSTTRKFGGTGLGLAICKRIVELMGGAVGVESEYGKGSTFWATIPLRKSTAAPRRLLLSSDLEGKRVLVVDDNEHARLVLKDLLEQMKFEVDTASSGQAALDAVAQSDAQACPYEIVFLDWQMPGMDGLEVVRRMQMLSLKHRPHHLLVTAYGRDEVFKRAEAIEIADVLVKPVNASTLFDSLVHLLSGTVQQAKMPAYETSSALIDRLSVIRGATILLVEDNEMNQEVALELLSDVGFRVELAENGRIAVEKVRRGRYDLVLMDMQMPEMDGVEATITIRKDARFQTLPIVAMTANVLQGDRDRCLQAGMNDHVAKPIEPDELWKALLKWIPPQSNGSTELAGTVCSEGVDAMLIPTDIPGLNTSEGLRRVLGKHSLYLSMLRKFVAGQATFADQVVQALDIGNEAQAERLAHTLKGISGNIGAIVIQEAAAALEAAIRKGQPRCEVDALLMAVSYPLDVLIGQLKNKLHPEAPVAEVEIDSLKLEAVCTKLAALLMDDDAEAVDLLRENADLLRSAFPQEYEAIEAGVNAFDFEVAYTALVAARTAKANAGLS